MKTDQRQKFKRQYKAKKVRRKFSKKPKLIHKVMIHFIFHFEISTRVQALYFQAEDTKPFTYTHERSYATQFENYHRGVIISNEKSIISF